MQKVPLLSLGKTGLKVSKLGFGEIDFGDEDAIKLLPRKDVIISYKTSAKSCKKALSLHSFLKELGTDYVDILLLHCVRSGWRGWLKAVKELSDIKTTGLVRAVGLSTHSVTVVRQASQIKEVNVILTICCKASAAVIEKCIPIEDGTIKEMYDAIKLAHENGKGTIAMKILGGRVRGPASTLIRNYKSSIGSIAGLDFVDACS
jgi:aryl-alcohol dehydrogenase-like predicted oxidoreductase